MRTFQMYENKKSKIQNQAKSKIMIESVLKIG